MYKEQQVLAFIFYISFWNIHSHIQMIIYPTSALISCPAKDKHVFCTSRACHHAFSGLIILILGHTRLYRFSF